ncbi:type IX secretion system sortase PorU [Hymenobacter sp. NBH84]|nr:type IX secretion system sortase PorU [Hymenobacter sp. NBH84]
MRFPTSLLLACLLVLVALVPSQAQTVFSQQLAWQGYTTLTSPNGQERRVPTFRGATYEPGARAGLYTLRINGRVSEGQMENAMYEAFAATDARAFEGATFPAGPTLRFGMANRQPITYVDLPAVRRNAQSGQVEKLISFDYRYVLGGAGTTANRPSRTQRTHTSASVLRQGTWYKIGVPESGVYKLDKAALTSLGISVQSTDPRRIQVFGNAAGGMLPQLNGAPRPADLEELALGFVGNADAVFDDNEYLTFYSRGPHVWERDPMAPTPRFRHVQHLYTDTAYYFVTVGTGAGRRITAATTAAAPTATITTFAHRDYYEHDIVNIQKSGRQWLGEPLEGGTLEVPFTVPNAVLGAAVQLTSSVAASSLSASTVQLALNGQNAGTQSILGRSASSYPERANTAVTTLAITPTSLAADTRVRYTFSSTDGSARAWLDYVELNTQRQLRYVGSGRQLDFRSFSNIAPQAVSRFTVDNVGSATVWEVTHPARPVAYPLSSGNFVAPTDSLREFVAWQEADLYTPRLFGRVGNQNLHALNLDGKTDLVIVTHPLFLSEAERLAAHRRTHDGLTVQVVTTAQVYNEYSSGGQDITAIRDLMKQVYDRAASGKQLYLLLFGDASFDYKSDPTNDLNKVPTWWKLRYYLEPRTLNVTNPTPDRANQNYVPVYESRESFAVVAPRSGQQGVTFSTDDYFGLLDDNEGELNESYSATDELMDIGVGRLPVRVSSGTNTAALTVNKLIRYDDPTTYGKWRNRLTFVADDGDYNLHTLYSAEPLANALVANQPAYNVHKVYLDMYPQIAASAGQSSPACMQAIDESLEQGTLIMNYSGHGGPEGWADERILTRSSIQALQNSQRLAFLLTATCDFSTYDDPDRTSAGEEMLTNVEGGAVGLLTTTRLVFSNNNQALAESFYAAAFTPINGVLPRMGDILAETKNNSVRSVYNRNFSFLGDPSSRLAYPEQTVTLRSINGNTFTTTPTDTLKSLSRVQLVGDVRVGGVVNASFNGTTRVTVFEKPETIRTLGSEPTDGPQPIQVQENILYDGQATVRNGQFSLRFVVPKDINYNYGLGKISFYAADSVRRIDAHGATRTVVGGLDATAALDTIPPTIRLFMDNESFVFGGLTGTSPTLLAHLTDSSGINTAGSGIGHEITATLDGDASKLVILNDFYTADVDKFQSGKVRYLFKELSTGPHLLRLKAWDTFNNSGEKEIEFIAASTEKLALQHVLNYPNPFSQNTTFHFDHNRTGDELDIQVQIFTVSGKLVRTLRTTVLGSESHLAALSWDGRDEYNDQLARGVYVYRVSVRSMRDRATASKFEKLVILN